MKYKSSKAKREQERLNEIASIAEIFEKYKVRYDVNDFSTGHMICYRKKDFKKIQYWVTTGTIMSDNKRLANRGRQALMDYIFNKLPISSE